MVMSRDQNAGRSHNMKFDNSSFGRVEQFRYLRTNLTNQNSIQEENKGRLKSKNACYHSGQNTIYKTTHLKSLLTTGRTQCRFLRQSSLILSSRVHTHAVFVKSTPYRKKRSCQYKQLSRCSPRTFTVTFIAAKIICQCGPSLNP